jgi:miniconductance mechanosensitive channel
MNTESAAIYGDKLHDLLLRWGFSEKLTGYIVDFSVLVIILFVSVIIYYILKIIINRFLKRLVERSASKWDDYLYEERVFTRLTMLVPALILQVSLPAAISTHPQAIHYLGVGLKLYMIAIMVLVANSFLNTVYRIYGEMEVADSKPIKGYIQVGKIIVFVVGGIILISAMIGQSPLNILAGLGAISAVLLLIFKDSILGFVAGVQLSSNHMLQIGDWISLPRHNSDGVVIDISLVTVKIRNWDNSVSLIPTYTLVSESFLNWRSMSDAGGRRMRRFLLIDVRSVKACDPELRERISKLGVPADAFKSTAEPQTNLGLFRYYAGEYLKKLPGINLPMGILVRSLQVTDSGLPLELTAYSTFPDLPDFEAFQSGLFEHLYSVLPWFDLKVYQKPSGSDAMQEPARLT